MGSPTRVTERRRELRRIKLGTKRKRAIRIDGTTAAPLPLNVPNANERAQIAARKKS